MRGEAGRGAGRGGAEHGRGRGEWKLLPQAKRASGVFSEEFLRGPPRGPGGLRTGESALTHAQLHESGWTPRPAPQGSGSGAPRGSGRAWSLKW